MTDELHSAGGMISVIGPYHKPGEAVCLRCGYDIPREEVLWIDVEGNVQLDGENASPYHETCAP